MLKCNSNEIRISCEMKGSFKMDKLTLMCNNCYEVVVNCGETPIDCPHCGSIETWVLKIPMKESVRNAK